ncbi:MAG TPA: SDR family oxidoreductase [Acidimicrobiia bacterium]|nr:SDR family oxidoreductase [Acidimicrobiia bacterium]
MARREERRAGGHGALQPHPPLVGGRPGGHRHGPTRGPGRHHHRRGLSGFTYSQTKWGVVGLTKFLASQLGQYNITVKCIAPGVTMTEATKKIVPEAFIDLLPAMSAMKRKLEPEDFTGTAVFFASDDAALVTGQVLCVDGGSIMPA